MDKDAMKQASMPSMPKDRRTLLEYLNKLQKMNAPEHLRTEALREFIEATKFDQYFDPVTLMKAFETASARRMPNVHVRRPTGNLLVPGAQVHNDIARRMAVRRAAYLRSDNAWQVELMRNPFFSNSAIFW